MNIDIQKQQEHIQKDLQSMQSSLEILKKSLDQDAALATKQECITLMKDIVQQMSTIEATDSIIDLQKKLEQNNNISPEILQDIINSFIVLKLHYTESVVDSEAEQLLEKYSGLVSKKSELDSLLVSLQTPSTYQVQPQANVPAASNPSSNTPAVDPEKKEDGWLMRNTKAIFSKEERQKDRKSNALRTASGLAIVGGAVRGIKKLFSWMSGDSKEKSSDTKEGMSWWKKGLLAVGGIGAGWGIWKNWDTLKGWLGFGEKLSFEDSISKVEGDFRTISEQNIKTGFDGIVYDDASGLLKSFGREEVKIDKSKKRIDGLDIKFSDYSQLIFTANFINAVKRNYAGKCPNNSPFSLDWGGDLMITTNDTGDSKKVEVMSGGFFSTLATYAPDVDGGVWSKIFGGGKEGRAKLQAYLNRLDIWKSGRVGLQENPDLPSTNDLQNDIVNTKPEMDHGGRRGPIETYKIPGSDNKYEIKSYKHSVFAEYKEGIGYRIEGLDISFEDDTELIRVATFINKMKDEYEGTGVTVSPFSYEMEYFDKGIWINTTKKRENAWFKDILTNKINVLDRTTIKDKMPTVWQGSNIDNLVSYLNMLKKDSGSWWQ